MGPWGASGLPSLLKKFFRAYGSDLANLNLGDSWDSWDKFGQVWDSWDKLTNF